MNINVELKNKWLAALRSGDYVQGNTFLLKDGKYCCLGVLCELAAKDNSRIIVGPGDRDDSIAFDSFANTVPISVMSQLITHNLPLYDVMWGTAIRMNDKERKTFPEIADYLERALVEPSKEATE